MRKTPRPKGKNVQPRRLTVLISEYSLKPITDISLRSEKPVKSKILDDFEKIRNFVQRLLLRVSCEFDSRRGCQKEKPLVRVAFLNYSLLPKPHQLYTRPDTDLFGSPAAFFPFYRNIF